ncbi:YesL family protein [Lederbergia lenta]|uniref:Integral membrane protein n=1 Tax=Lederbergia lenta TaxID=1467 RepID=A0A2X4W9D8_LEDLE|nr:YesL family protein [Lederbergia lenta]MCM3110414.1 YesL family protein [Lederbergia lenta]MEC2324019.1 YesL family protein [Lederbergia lenta]SQI60816.1 integral membrane protein [Lederbergia lenta]
MKLGGFDGLFFRSCEVISKLAYVNALWFLFTVIGLGVFGIAPATVALFTINRKWMLGETDVPIFNTYWKVYRKEFLKSNLLGLALMIVGFILYVDLAYLPTEGFVYTIIRYAIIAVSFVFLIVLLYIFPVYVHFNGNLRKYFKYALVCGLSYPHFTFMMIIAAMLLYTGLSLFPGIIPFFSFCMLAYMVMWIALQVFKRVENAVIEKQQKVEVVKEKM